MCNLCTVDFSLKPHPNLFRLHHISLHVKPRHYIRLKNREPLLKDVLVCFTVDGVLSVEALYGCLNGAGTSICSSPTISIITIYGHGCSLLPLGEGRWISFDTWLSLKGFSSSLRGSLREADFLSLTGNQKCTTPATY